MCHSMKNYQACEEIRIYSQTLRHKVRLEANQAANHISELAGKFCKINLIILDLFKKIEEHREK